MSRTLIDVDDEMLGRASELLGTGTKKDTVNAALAEVVRAEMRRKHVEHLLDGGLADLSDPAVMDGAWH